MRIKTLEALEKTTNITSEAPALIVKKSSAISLNWFGSKESIGKFTNRLRAGLRDTPRASHGLESRPLVQIIAEKTIAEQQTNKVVNLPDLSDALKREALISA